MSVFSRIFQKNPPRDSKKPEPDAESSKDDAATNHSSNHVPPADATAHKRSTSPRRSMRPVAPPLDMRSEGPPTATATPAQQPQQPVQQPAATNSHAVGDALGPTKGETTLVLGSPGPTDQAAPASVPRPPPYVSRGTPASAKTSAGPASRGNPPPLPERPKASARKPAAPAAPAPPAVRMDEIDAAFGALVDTNPKGAARDPRANAAPIAPPPDVRELFVAIAANHMRPLRDVMIGLKWGDALSSPAAICSPIVSSLMKAANEMGFAELTKGLGAFAGVLNSKAAGEGALDAAAREAILSAYAGLSREMPDVFALEGEQGRREAVIVHALLRQIPGVSHLAMGRLYAAGLANLDMMLLAKPDAIVSTTGIDHEIASSIVDKFQTYRKETRDAQQSVGREKERDRLAGLAVDLRRLHEHHERAASGWSDDAVDTKKKLRHARNEVFMQVKVLLARLGELDRVRELETMSFQSRIDRLDAYLRENGTPMNNGGRG
jgi:hypothetical protein